jgi:hypothetical protein
MCFCARPSARLFGFQTCSQGFQTCSSASQAPSVAAPWRTARAPPSSASSGYRLVDPSPVREHPLMSNPDPCQRRPPRSRRIGALPELEGYVALSGRRENQQADPGQLGVLRHPSASGGGSRPSLRLCAELLSSPRRWLLCARRFAHAQCEERAPTFGA